MKEPAEVKAIILIAGFVAGMGAFQNTRIVILCPATQRLASYDARPYALPHAVKAGQFHHRIYHGCNLWRGSPSAVVDDMKGQNNE